MLPEPAALRSLELEDLKIDHYAIVDLLHAQNYQGPTHRNECDLRLYDDVYEAAA